MAMLGGECSKCCTRGLKCYVPESKAGACCKLSDGSCSVEAECDCDTSAGDRFSRGEPCAFCRRYCATVSQFSRACVVLTEEPSIIDGQPFHGGDPAREVGEGEPCECCPQRRPEENPFFSSIVYGGIDNLNRQLYTETCGCCAETAAGRIIHNDYPPSLTVEITGTNIYLDGTYELPLETSVAIPTGYTITEHCVVYRKGLYFYGYSSNPADDSDDHVLKWSPVFPDRPCSFHTYSPAGVDICVERTPENNRFALLGMSATLESISLQFQYFGRIRRGSWADCSCGVVVPTTATGPIASHGNWLCGSGPQTASGSLFIHPECKDYSEATDGQFTVTANPLP